MESHVLRLVQYVLWQCLIPMFLGLNHLLAVKCWDCCGSHYTLLGPCKVPAIGFLPATSYRPGFFVPGNQKGAANLEMTINLLLFVTLAANICCYSHIFLSSLSVSV